MFEVYHLCPRKGKHPETQMAKYTFMLFFSERKKKVVSKYNSLNFQLCSALKTCFLCL